MSRIVLIQRNFPEFREAFFDSIFEDNEGFLICSGSNDSKITPPLNYKAKRYYTESFTIKFFGGLAFSPLLFFKLLHLSPNKIVTEGAKHFKQSGRLFLRQDNEERIHNMGFRKKL